VFGPERPGFLLRGPRGQPVIGLCGCLLLQEGIAFCRGPRQVQDIGPGVTGRGLPVEIELGLTVGKGIQRRGGLRLGNRVGNADFVGADAQLVIVTQLDLLALMQRFCGAIDEGPVLAGVRKCWIPDD